MKTLKIELMDQRAQQVSGLEDKVLALYCLIEARMGKLAAVKLKRRSREEEQE